MLAQPLFQPMIPGTYPNSTLKILIILFFLLSDTVTVSNHDMMRAVFSVS